MGWLELVIGRAIGWFVIAPIVSPLINKAIGMAEGVVDQVSSGQARAYPTYQSGRPVHYQKMRSFR